jgi:hypothetical protein
MIDTVCLLIPKHEMRYFSGVENWDVYSKTDQYERFIRNPTKTQKESGKYYPRLTSYKRGFSQDANVRVEFSASKLLYLNNLDELEDKDFLLVVEILQQRLQEMGVDVSKSVLENASVSSVHYSKNILLSDGYTASHLISEIGKVNAPKRFDVAKTRFINDGQSLYAHTSTHQFVIYDKVADLQKDRKRAIDKDQTPQQRSRFRKLNKHEEILRFEVRLIRKQKLNKVIESLGYQKNPTFKDIFSEEISRKVVLDYWDNLIKGNSLGIFSISLSTKDTLRIILLADSKIKPKQAVYLLGLSMLAKDENGLRELRSIISKNSNDRTWYRLTKDIEHANNLITKNHLRDWVIQVDTTLQNYKPYKTKKYENKQTETY